MKTRSRHKGTNQSSHTNGGRGQDPSCLVCYVVHRATLARDRVPCRGGLPRVAGAAGVNPPPLPQRRNLTIRIIVAHQSGGRRPNSLAWRWLRQVGLLNVTPHIGFLAAENRSHSTTSCLLLKRSSRFAKISCCCRYAASAVCSPAGLGRV